jgi:hypothetical protein
MKITQSVGRVMMVMMMIPNMPKKSSVIMSRETKIASEAREPLPSLKTQVCHLKYRDI